MKESKRPVDRFFETYGITRDQAISHIVCTSCKNMAWHGPVQIPVTKRSAYTASMTWHHPSCPNITGARLTLYDQMIGRTKR